MAIRAITQRSFSSIRRAFCSVETTMQFDVMAWNANYNGEWGSLEIDPPKEVACWTKPSIKEGGELKYGDRSGFCAFQECPESSNLSEGYPDKYIRKPDNKRLAGIEAVLGAVKHSKLDFQGTDVISFRNNFNKIFLTLMDLKKGWVVDACMLPDFDTMFLDIQEEEGPRDFPDADKFMYFGYKFETLCTGGGDGPVDSTSESAIVVQSKLEDLKILMAAEIDCYDAKLMEEIGDDPPGPAAYIEVKTSKMPAMDRQVLNAKRFKYPKWWLQSYLAGVPKIVVGYWDETGELKKTATFQTNLLPDEALVGVRGYHRKQMWRKDQILRFGIDVLKFMQGVTKEERNSHLRFKYNPAVKMVMAEIVPDGNLVVRVAQTLDLDDQLSKK